jgi:lysophospholipase L1-like esterase
MATARCWVLAALLAPLAALIVIVRDVHRPAPYDCCAIAPADVRPLVLVLGDSISHGVVSHNWLRDMARAHPALKFVNTAIPGHTSHTVLQTARALRLPRPPALVLVMVGTNDVMSALSPGARQFYVDAGFLPPDAPVGAQQGLRGYARSLDAIIRHAKTALGARHVVVISPPPFAGGRDTAADATSGSIWGRFEHQPNELAKRAAQSARAVAWWSGAAFVDLHAELASRLRALGQPGAPFVATPWQMARQMVNAALVKFVPGLTFDELSAYPFHHDAIHLNGRGAKVLQDLLVRTAPRVFGVWAVSANSQ